MKKIIGSPIGLGEVNLTVDKRVRRCIKEYFGDVDNNSFETIITPFGPDSKKQKIAVIADETYKDKVFILKINDVTIYFIPIKKVGNKLETEPYEIRDWDKIKDIVATTIMHAKLPTTDEEIADAKEWEEDKLERQDAIDQAELAAAEKTLLDQAGKDAAKETDKISKQECEAQYCKKYIKDGLDGYCVPDYKDEQKNEKGELILGCVESDPSGCCISKTCREKKGIWQTNNWKIGILVLSILFVVTSILLFVAVICSYYYYKKTGKGDYESITTTFPYSDYLKKSFVLGGIGCILLIPWVLFEAKIVSISVSCPEDKDKKEEEEEKDDSCPLGKSKKTCMDGTKKCRTICGRNKKFSTSKCKCVPK